MAAKPLLNKNTFINQVDQSYLALKNQDKSVILACSGGIDSMSLMAWMHESSVFKSQVWVCYCQHGYRERSAEKQDKTIIAKMAKSYGYAFQCLALDNPQGSNASETQLRTLRQDRLIAFAKEKQISQIFTAHHQDDHIETLMMQIGRGVQSAFWGIEAHKLIDDIYFVRPFLSLSKAAIRSFAMANTIPYHEDTSNAEAHCNRNHLRLNLIPELEKIYPHFGKHLIQLSAYQQQLQAPLDQQCQQILMKCVIKEDNCFVPKSALTALDSSFERYYFFHKMLNALKIDQVSENDIQRLEKSFVLTRKHVQVFKQDWYLNSDSHWILLTAFALDFPDLPIRHSIHSPKVILMDGRVLKIPQFFRERKISIAFAFQSTQLLEDAEAQNLFKQLKKKQIPYFERMASVCVIDKDLGLIWHEKLGCLQKDSNDNEKKFEIESLSIQSFELLLTLR